MASSSAATRGAYARRNTKPAATEPKAAKTETPEPTVDQSACIQRVLSDDTLVTEMFRVERSHLACLMGAMAVSDVRVYLEGIYLDLDEPCLVATNGHIMARCPVVVDQNAHRPVIDHLIWERFQPKDPNTGLRLINNPDQLIFTPEKLPAVNSGTLGVDLATKRIWSTEKYGPRFEGRIAKMQQGLYPQWRRVDVHLPGAFKAASVARPANLDIEILRKIYSGPVKIEVPDSDMSSFRITLGLTGSEYNDVKVTMQPVRL